MGLDLSVGKNRNSITKKLSKEKLSYTSFDHLISINTMAPPPPAPATRPPSHHRRQYHYQQQQPAAHAAQTSHTTTTPSPKKQPYASLRMRADSNGSVRGAFGGTAHATAIVTPTAISRNRSPKKKKNVAETSTAQRPFHPSQEATEGRSLFSSINRDSHLGPSPQSYAPPTGYGSLATSDVETGPPRRPTTTNASLGTGWIPPPPPSTARTTYTNDSSFMLSSAQPQLSQTNDSSDLSYEDDDDESTVFYEKTFTERISNRLALWLTYDLILHHHPEDDDPDDNAEPFLDGKNLVFLSASSKWTVPGLLRHFLYNPLQPEFTSLQQFNWAVILGVVMGVYTAYWKFIIESGIEFVWKTIPKTLLKMGLYTSPDGVFPVYHYMWMCPSVFGGILSWVFVTFPVPIPDQNEWISSLHTRGVQDHRTFFSLFILSTLGMWSGLSLGPELPLVLTSSMVGSWIAIICRQSMLSARVLNLTAASGAIGGFFGFPMAGALFCLELPHRMGLQYFEALSPATVASIVAVITNRLVVNNDVTGYFRYPFLTSSLPSEIFTSAVVYGFYGAAIGIIYVKVVKKCKTWVHDWFHKPKEDPTEAFPNFSHPSEVENDEFGENAALLSSVDSGVAKPPPVVRKTAYSVDSLLSTLKKYICFVIPDEPSRAAVAGCLAGALVGAIGIFVPHTMFWGEAQLQNLIDKGRTPLPIFGQGDEPTAPFTALGFCMIDGNDPHAVKAGFGVGCSALIAVSKTVVIGLSLGTGIIGGHFWGPLFVGCAASHFLTDTVNLFADWTGYGWSLSAYPCVAILCTMGSAHVVSFRAIAAISLVLTLTITAFNPEDEDVNSPFKAAGDYSAVFPLLVVSVFTALMVSRDTVFYATQRSRGDIQAVAEVLCEPNMAGRPIVHQFETSSDENSDEGDDDEDGLLAADILLDDEDDGPAESLTAQEIERQFNEASRQVQMQHSEIMDFSRFASESPSNSVGRKSFQVSNEAVSNTPINNSSEVIGMPPMSSARLDELLMMGSVSPLAENHRKPPAVSNRHRRTKSAPVVEKDAILDLYGNSPNGNISDLRRPMMRRNRERSNSVSKKATLLVRIDSYGELNDHQPSLLDQARMRASSAADFHQNHHRRIASYQQQHSRQNSVSSQNTYDNGGVLSLEEVDRNFHLAVEQQYVRRSPWTDNRNTSA